MNGKKNQFIAKISKEGKRLVIHVPKEKYLEFPYGTRIACRKVFLEVKIHEEA